MDKNEKIENLSQRTRLFTLDIIKLFQALPKSGEAQVIGKQLLRSGTSVGANYRAAIRSRSKAEFFSKLSIVVEEADESFFWPEILRDSKIFNGEMLSKLIIESEEFLKIMAKSRKTVSNNRFNKN